MYGIRRDRTTHCQAFGASTDRPIQAGALNSRHQKVCGEAEQRAEQGSREGRQPERTPGDFRRRNFAEGTERRYVSAGRQVDARFAGNARFADNTAPGSFWRISAAVARTMGCWLVS